ncbi:MAG: Zn-ribbon domain-containing OB-fold protein [Rhizomicrobium sp.]
MTYAKPLPVPDPESAPFWEGTRRHKLLIQQCGNCGRNRFPPTTFCSHCRSDAVRWLEASGRGKVFSWIVVRHPVPKDVYASDVPYVVAIIELDEGVRIVSNIVECDPSDVRAETPVRVIFRDVTDSVTLPLFVPASS